MRATGRDRRANRERAERVRAFDPAAVRLLEEKGRAFSTFAFFSFLARDRSDSASSGPRERRALCMFTSKQGCHAAFLTTDTSRVSGTYDLGITISLTFPRIFALCDSGRSRIFESFGLCTNVY